MRIVSCEGKVKYSSSSRANRWVRITNRKYDGLRMNSYKCKECGWWHIGQTAKRRKQWK